MMPIYITNVIGVQAKGDDMTKTRETYFYICEQCHQMISVQGIHNIKNKATGLCFQCSRQDENHSQWKGDKVGYEGLHQWVKRRKPKPSVCEICKQNKPYDLANISGEYKRDINDFQWLCRSCHMKSDGRVNNLVKGDNGCKRDKKGRYIKGGK